jgi:hypothetical protein
VGARAPPRPLSIAALNRIPATPADRYQRSDLQSAGSGNAGTIRGDTTTGTPTQAADVHDDDGDAACWLDAVDDRCPRSSTLSSRIGAGFRADTATVRSGRPKLRLLRQAGHDVIVPQLVPGPSSCLSLNGWPAPWERRSSSAAAHQESQLLVDRLGGVTALDRMHDDFVEIVGSRQRIRTISARVSNEESTLRELERLRAQRRPRTSGYRRVGGHPLASSRKAEVVAVRKWPGDVDVVRVSEVGPAARSFTTASAGRRSYTMFNVSRKRLAS